MSGIAGILRRDGRAIPQHWVKLLEESIALRGHGGSGKFEDRIETGSGGLEIMLLHQNSDAQQVNQPIVISEGESLQRVGVIDGSPEAFHRHLKGDHSVHCAAAVWDQDSLQLELIRTGSGLKPLYMLDLAEGGDGVAFCSVPTPLLQIANELEISSPTSVQSLHQYLLTGYMFGDENLLSPVKPVELQHPQALHTIENHGRSNEQIRISSSAGDDLVKLVSVLGQPFADSSLLPTLWKYRMWQHEKVCIDSINIIPNESQQNKALNLNRWHKLASKVPSSSTSIQLATIWEQSSVTSMDYYCSPQKIEFFTGFDFQLPMARQHHASVLDELETFVQEVVVQNGVLRHLDAAATTANIEVDVQMSANSPTPQDYPLTTWLQNSESSIGQLAGDFFTSQNAFSDLPIDRQQVANLFDAHRAGDCDESRILFMLLTLGLWRRQVMQP